MDRARYCVPKSPAQHPRQADSLPYAPLREPTPQGTLLRADPLYDLSHTDRFGNRIRNFRPLLKCDHITGKRWMSPLTLSAS